LQDTQVPSHAFSQHTPSTQKPEAQTLALAQATPFFVLQLPLRSHACPAAQLAEISVPGAAGLQVPSWPATAQDWQAPEQTALPQQTPSTQNPEAQLDAVVGVHPSPVPSLVTLYSQVSLVIVFAEGFGPETPPNSTSTPRLLSKAVLACARLGSGPGDRVRKYQVGARASSSQVSTVKFVPFKVAALVPPMGTMCRRRRLS
jgi:hypothetical protein